MGAGFDTLPDEVIIRIFKELGVSDVLNCTLTCRLFHMTIRDSVILQYQLELAVAGMRDTDCEHIAVADRLAQLKTVQHGWANLHFRQRRQMQYNPANVWELFGGVLAQGISMRGLAFMELPSAVNVASGHTWEHRDLGVDIRDFGMDPAQDLLVLIAFPVPVALSSAQQATEFLVHLRTMGAGEKHPLASEAALSFIEKPEPEHMQNDFVIQIMANFIGILFHTPNGSYADELFIWDWKIGRLVTNLKASSSTGKIDSFSFLSPRHIVISRFEANPDDRRQDPAALEVFDFLARRSEESTAPQLEHTYELPRLAAGYFLGSMITRSDPSPSSFSHSFTSCGRPFYTAPTSRLLAVSMDFHSPWGHASSYVLFVHHSSLLKSLDPDSRLEGVLVPWEHWGPTETRLIRTGFNEPTYVCYVHGTRYVRLAITGHTETGIPSSQLRVLDFNPLAMRRACTFSGETKSPPSQEDSRMGDITTVLASQPTILHPSDSVFATSVYTTLPYSEVKTRETFNYWAIMIDEDCLVGRYQEIPENGFVEILCI